MFSIIMPAYNEGKRIYKSINSILCQTYSQFELIIIDDGSTDNTLEILKEISLNDSRVRIFSQANSGPSKARNVGIDNAKNSLILFVDADDLIEESLLESISLNSGYYNDRILFFPRKINGTFKKYTMNKGVYRLSDVIKHLIISEEINSIWGKVYSNQNIEKNKLRFNENIHMGEDLLFNLSYLQTINKVEVSMLSYYSYDGNVSGSLTNDKTQKKYIELEKLHNILEKDYIDLINNLNIFDEIKFIKYKNKLSFLRFQVSSGLSSETEVLSTIKELKTQRIAKHKLSLKWSVILTIVNTIPSKILILLLTKYYR